MIKVTYDDGADSIRHKLKCGCCTETLEIVSSKSDDWVEINGVIGRKEEWRKILLPIIGEDDEIK